MHPEAGDAQAIATPCDAKTPTSGRILASGVGRLSAGRSTAFAAALALDQGEAAGLTFERPFEGSGSGDWPVRARPKIVRPIDTPRLTAASVGVARKMGEVLNNAGAQWEPRLLANLYAAAAVQADDAHGAEHELVTQHYDIRRADLVAVIELAERALDARHGVPGAHGECSACDAVVSFGRVRGALEWTAPVPNRPA